MEALSGVLLELYRAARTIPAPEFKDAALAAAREGLRFEASMWGSFVHTPGGARVHAVHLFNLPARKMSDYEQVKRSDFLHFKCCANPGHTYAVCGVKMEHRLDPALRAYVRRYRLWNVMSTAVVERGLGIWTAISVYRGRRGPPFSERERRLMQALVPHLVEAWNANAIWFVDRAAGLERTRGRARAMIDREGMLYNAEPGFAALVRSEFGGWEGPYLPRDALRPLAAGGGEPYRGNAILISRLREIEEGMYLIAARALAGIDRLSPRESSVAHAYAEGKTYKQIAASLGISPATVRNQLQSAYAKLGVGSKIDLARQLGEAS